MLLARGDATVFFTRPLSAALLALAVLLIGALVLPAVRQTREVAFQED